jgi:serine/threonine-protein kinase
MVSIDDGGFLTLGRFDLAGADRSISRKHVTFSRIGDRYFVQDAGSRNGTVVRGIAVTVVDPPVEIRHGDRVNVGDVFLRFAFMRSA